MMSESIQAASHAAPGLRWRFGRTRFAQSRVSLGRDSVDEYRQLLAIKLALTLLYGLNAMPLKLLTSLRRQVHV